MRLLYLPVYQYGIISSDAAAPISAQYVFIIF